MAGDKILERIDAKLAALLSIAVDRYLRETGIARPRTRSVDQMLMDAGLGASEVAALLGKTERAVYKLLQEKQKKVEGHRAARARGRGPGRSEKRSRTEKEGS